MDAAGPCARAFALTGTLGRGLHGLQRIPSQAYYRMGLQHGSAEVFMNRLFSKVPTNEQVSDQRDRR
jgi:hypothetical protein